MSKAQFLNLISDINKNKKDFADNIYKMHKNHTIVTSSHESGYSPTFGTIRINDNKKLVAGSPTMGAYIIEVLMKRSLCKNSINNIKRIVYGNHANMIYEYATSPIQVKKKKWVRLNINYWESKSFFHKKILNKQDRKNIQINIGYIMNLIGYRLIARCNIQFNSQNYCITRKMQPLYKRQHKLNFIGIRLAYINQDYDYSQGTTDDDSYYNEYSEGSTNYNTTLDKSRSSTVTPSSSFEKLFDNLDYDIVISQEYFAKIIKEVKLDDLLIYQLRFLAVFKHELNKIKKSKQFNKNYQYTNHEAPKNVPSIFRSSMYDWIRHFFPPYILQEELDNFVLLFYVFMTNYNIPEKNTKDIFYICMNIADQVASQSSNVDKKAAYDVKRLKS